MGDLQSLSMEGALSEDVKPQAVFSFKDYFGEDFDKRDYHFELSKDESEIRVRQLKFNNNSTTRVEWFMTETTPGDGFTIIHQQPSAISDLLKDVGIKLQNNS